MSKETKEKADRTAILLLMFLIMVVLVVGYVFLKLWSDNKLNKDVGKASSAKIEDNKEEKEKEKDKNKDNKNNEITKNSAEIEIVPTLLDEISNNSAWCATFQLVWNDMQDEVVKQDIEFNPQLEVVENLNEQTFKEENIEDEYYYKIYGLKTLDLKEKIEKGIKEKFNQTSDVLDQLDWSDTPKPTTTIISPQPTETAIVESPQPTETTITTIIFGVRFIS